MSPEAMKLKAEFAEDSAQRDLARIRREIQYIEGTLGTNCPDAGSMVNLVNSLAQVLRKVTEAKTLREMLFVDEES